MTVTFLPYDLLFETISNQIDKDIICFKYPKVGEEDLYSPEFLIKIYIIDKQKGYFLYENNQLYPALDIYVNEVAYSEIDLPENYSKLIPTKFIFKDLDELNVYLAEIRHAAIENAIGEKHWEITNQELLDYYNKLYSQTLNNNRSLIHGTYLYQWGNGGFNNSRVKKEETVMKIKADTLRIRQYFIKNGFTNSRSFMESDVLPVKEFAYLEQCPIRYERDTEINRLGIFHEDF